MEASDTPTQRNYYDELAARYEAPVLKGPFNLEARRRAGFTEAELVRFS